MLNMTMEQYIQQAQECTQAGDKTDTIANYRLAIELDANQPASMYNVLGYQLLNNNEVDAAEQIFQLLIEKYPSQSEGLAGLAPVAQRHKQWELALQRWNECLEKFPNQVLWWWHVNKGYALIELQQFDVLVLPPINCV